MSHEETRLLLPADSAWLALESPDNPMTITVLMRVEDLTADRLTEFLAVYWLAWERFRSMPVRHPLGWCWEADPTFALGHHLDVVPDAFDETQLQTWVSARLNQPLPTYRPRWKFWLVPNASGGAALLLRIHHCYADGLALMGVFDQICTRSPQQAPVYYGGRESSEIRQWGRGLWHWLDSVRAESGLSADFMGAWQQFGAMDDSDRDNGEPPLRSAPEQAVLASARLVNELSQFLVEPDDTPSPLKRILLGRRCCRWSEPLPLAGFRDAAHNLGCTINDLLLACVTGALRQYLQDAGVAMADAILHAAIPVDIRGRLPDELQPESGALGNYFGTVFVPLPVDGASPLEWVYRVKHETRRLKKSWQPGIAWGLTGSASLMPASVREMLRTRLCDKASAVVSNVPGTREHRYLAGCRIREQMCWVPQAGNIGLGVSIVSYAGQVQFGVVADEAVMPEPEVFLAQCVTALGAYVGDVQSGP